MASLQTTIESRTTDDGHSTAVTFLCEGRFGLGIDQWAYVPFDVPAGVTRISVDTAHERFSLLGVARNVLDLGIFGPPGHQVGTDAGFRGWSGGARANFTLSAGDATPGYLPGPIEPGRWALALGPVVLNPLGMRWSASIKLTSAVTQDVSAPVAVPPKAMLDRGAGWFRGDLHLHTVQSDGRLQPDELTAAAEVAGLDFIVSTEHNTSAGNLAWSATRTDGLLVIAGEEVTTRHGHWLAVGLPQAEWIDWRYSPRDRVIDRYAAQVRNGGGMVVAAHPCVPLPGAAWEFGFGAVDAVEVWNGRWNVDDEVALRIWHRLISRGEHIAAVGGSDSHGPHQRVGSPQTVVWSPELSTPAIVGALRRGHCYLAESKDVILDLSASCVVGGITLTARPGETLTVPDDTEITVIAAVAGAPDTSLILIGAQGRMARAHVDDSGNGRLQWKTTNARLRFVRIELRRPLRQHGPSMVSLTNPIWFDPPYSN